MPAWAQAEMFYDCGTTWAKCNGDDEAMWHFKWRPRLRRFNQPVDATLRGFAPEITLPPPRRGPERFADDLARDAVAPALGFRSNAALRRDLSRSIEDPTTNAQGVH